MVGPDRDAPERWIGQRIKAATLSSPMAERLTSPALAWVSRVRAPKPSEFFTAAACLLLVACTCETLAPPTNPLEHSSPLRFNRGTGPLPISTLHDVIPAATLRVSVRTHHFVRTGRYHRARVKYDSKTLATYQGCRLGQSGDIELNPGPPSAPGGGKQLSMLLQNVQSIKNKLGDWRQAAPSLQSSDVIALTETWLNDTVLSSEMEAALHSHILFRRDRGGRLGGGVACLINRQLRPERREHLEPPGAEMLVMELRTRPGLLLAVCYCPPDDNAALATTMAALQQVVQSAPTKAVLAAGDFNVPDIIWRPRQDQGHGTEPQITRRSARTTLLLDGCDVAGLTQFVVQPTRGHNYLDLIISKGAKISAVVHQGLIPSDHLAVACDVGVASQLPPLVSRRSALNYKRADWDAMRRALRLAPWHMLEGVPVDEALETFYDLLTSAIRDHIPVVTLSRQQPPWFDRELRSALREKEAAHRRMKKHQSEENRQDFSEKRRQFKRLTNVKFAKYLKGLICDLSSNPKRFWSFLKCLKGKCSGIATLLDGDRKIECDREKAELLNRTFADKFSDPAVNMVPTSPDYICDRQSVCVSCIRR